MPKTKFEELIFCCIMVLTMVYFMTLYNAFYSTHNLPLSMFRALFVMWPEVMGAFLIQRYIGGPLSQKLMPFIIDVKTAPKRFIIPARALCTVFIMAPSMTLFVTILHHGISLSLPWQWLMCLGRNFWFALLIQIFLAGPFVRFTFKNIFRRKQVA